MASGWLPECLLGDFWMAPRRMHSGRVCRVPLACTKKKRTSTCTPVVCDTTRGIPLFAVGAGDWHMHASGLCHSSWRTYVRGWSWTCPALRDRSGLAHPCRWSVAQLVAYPCPGLELDLSDVAWMDPVRLRLRTGFCEINAHPHDVDCCTPPGPLLQCWTGCPVSPVSPTCKMNAHFSFMRPAVLAQH